MRLLLTLLVLLIVPNVVNAHPLDEIGDIRTYDQKQILTIAKDRLELEIDLTFYPLDKNKVWESIDKNRDQLISESEREVWMKLGQEASYVENNDQNYPFLANLVTFPSYYDFFSTKPANVAIFFSSAIENSNGDVFTYHYLGKDQKLDEIAFEINGRGGLVAEEVTKKDSESVAVKVGLGNEDKSTIQGLQTSNKLDHFLNSYVKVDLTSPQLIVTAFIVAFVIGMLHALTPGHGKALVAGYLIGEKGTVVQAVHLGLIITFTHTISVFILGIGTIFLTQKIIPAQVIKWLSIVSGGLVFIFGLALFIQRLVHLIQHKHGHTHDHSHPEIAETSLSWKNIIPLGVSGGIVPCIDALAILIVAVSLGKAVFGMLIILAFSLGLASALILAGVAVVITKNKAAKRITHLAKYESCISLASALVVTLLGIALFFNSLI